MSTPATCTSDCLLGAVVLQTGRAAAGVSAAEMAEAAGCDATLVARIESGEHDPSLDTLERLVNSIGLELRCGPREETNPLYSQVDLGEVQRLADDMTANREFWAQFNRGPSYYPPAGTQAAWDGTPPAPPRLFGAGPGRRDEGGWAAMLVRRLRSETTLSTTAAAEAGISVDSFLRIETGAVRPGLAEVRRLFAARGKALWLRLEVYDPHDDVLHQRAVADPDRFEQTIRSTHETAAANAVAVGTT